MASLLAQTIKNCLQCRRPGFDTWVEKIPWRRKWQPTPVFLPGEFHGQRSLAGYCAWDCRLRYVPCTPYHLGYQIWKLRESTCIYNCIKEENNLNLFILPIVKHIEFDVYKNIVIPYFINLQFIYTVRFYLTIDQKTVLWNKHNWFVNNTVLRK